MTHTRIVVPCFNEADRLDAAAFRRFVHVHRNVGFLFVNDGSVDTTGEILDGLSRERPGLFDALQLPQNQGKAEAVRRGMIQALSTGAQVVGFWDADLSTPLDSIPVYLDALSRRSDVSLVLGTRMPLLGRSIQRNRMRQRAGRVFARCASWVVGLPIYDTQCGAKLLRVDETTRTLFHETFLSRWIFDVEMLVRWTHVCRSIGITDLGSRIYEVPLDVWREVKGSKLKGRDFAKAARELWQIHRKYSATPYSPISADGRLRRSA